MNKLFEIAWNFSFYQTGARLIYSPSMWSRTCLIIIWLQICIQYSIAIIILFCEIQTVYVTVLFDDYLAHRFTKDKERYVM